jgi:microcystin-dependent protein
MFLGGATTTTTLLGNTFTSSGITFNGNTLSLGTALTTVNVGQATTTTTLNGTVILSNTPTENTHAATKFYIDKLVNPIGTIILYAASVTPPTGYEFCDGTFYSTTGTYAALYGVIGTVYGSGSGSFAVPDLRNRFPLGAATTASMSTTTGGTYYIQTTHMPQHSHELTYTYKYDSITTVQLQAGGSSEEINTITQTSSQFQQTSESVQQADTTQVGGNGTFLPPYNTVQYVIRYAII